MNTLKVGFAEVDITPTKPVNTVGFNRKDNISRGILKPLLAQVSVWESNEICCLITIDSLGFKMELTDKLRNLVGTTLGISTDKVMVCFSHCHSAPNADAYSDYYELVCRKIAFAANNAKLRMQEVSIGWDNAFIDIGVNRRKGNNKLDRRAGILKVCDAKNGDPKLIMLRITAHCNVLKRDNYMISPDFFGNIREVLSEEFNCPIMIIQGAAGDIAPKYYKSIETPIDASGEEFIRSETALEDIARVVSAQVIPAIKRMQQQDNILGQMYSEDIVFFAEVPTYERAQAIAKESIQNCGIDGTNWLKEVKKLRDMGIEIQEERTEVQYFKIGDWCLCGVPYELMVEFALETSEKLCNEYFYLNGYTNGCLSYFPTEEEFDLGGYEVYWSILLYYPYYNRVFPLMRDSAAKLVDFVIENAK